MRKSTCSPQGFESWAALLELPVRDGLALADRDRRLVTGLERAALNGKTEDGQDQAKNTERNVSTAEAIRFYADRGGARGPTSTTPLRAVEPCSWMVGV